VIRGRAVLSDQCLTNGQPIARMRPAGKNTSASVRRKAVNDEVEPFEHVANRRGNDQPVPFGSTAAVNCSSNCRSTHRPDRPVEIHISDRLADHLKGERRAIGGLKLR
jgi:hypothetical protein